MLLLKLAAAVFLVQPQLLLAVDDGFDTVRTALRADIDRRVFPGCSALVGLRNGSLLFQQAFGNSVYMGDPDPPAGPNEPVSEDARFDLASLTKVIATTTAVMQLYQRGLLGLHEPIWTILGAGYAAHGKDAITVRNLLLHDAGLPPDPSPNYWDPQFGCPQTVNPSGPLEDFSCQQRIYDSVLQQTLINPVGTKFVYSDLSMITMMFVVGAKAKEHGLVDVHDLLPSCAAGHSGGGVLQCWYEAFVRAAVTQPYKMTSSGFLPPAPEWPSIPPTWNDTSGYAPPGGPPYRRRVLQGQVSDGNAYALGGIAGHAGFFADASDLFLLLSALMKARAEQGPPVSSVAAAAALGIDASLRPNSWLVNGTTVRKFTTIVNQTQSSRALGWDTNDHVANSYRGCGNLSALTFTHTGYTGTQVCNDVERGLITILLTNRVYPRANEESLHTIHVARQEFNNLVKGIFDKSSD
eukprot:COSAG02_NODE_70_length_42239_cov_15.323090_14_plen_466_part_00